VRDSRLVEFLIRHRFRQKIFFVAAGSVLLALVLSGAYTVCKFRSLGGVAALSVEQGLWEANDEYLSNYILTIAERSHLVLNQAFSEVRVLAGLIQELLDHPEEANRLGEVMAQSSAFSSPLQPVVRSNQVAWAQNAAPARSVVSVWQPMVEANGTVRSNALEAIQSTAILDLILPGMTDHGAPKLYMYMVGPHQRSYIRLAHYFDMASEFDRTYPGSTSGDFWDTFFPGLVDNWNELAARLSRDELSRWVTTTPPYQDAAGGGVIVSIFQPVWQWQEGKATFAGAAAMDLSLDNILGLVRDVKLAQSGFAFIAESSGNVLAIHPQGEAVMGLQTTTDCVGVNVNRRELGQSTQPNVRSLRLPQSDEVQSSRLDLRLAEGKDETYLFTMLRLPPVKVWRAASDDSSASAIVEERWTLAFVEKESEIYAPLTTAKRELNRTQHDTLRGFTQVGGIALLVALLGAFVLSRRLTQGLMELAHAARRMQKKDYNVRVCSHSHDEVGQLAEAFNEMAETIRDHILQEEEASRRLKSTVEERTAELSATNHSLEQEIGERKRMEEDLRDAVEAAQSANVAKGQFLAHMSHEIRTPMNAILGMAELLGEGSLNTKQARYLTTLQSSGEHLLMIINDILDFSKLEAHRIQLDEIAFSVRDVVEKCAQLLSVQALEKSLEFEVDVAPEMPTYLLGDALRLRQVVFNLLGNAVKFTAKGRVRLRVAPLEGNRYFLEISDTGFGIAKDKIPHLFERFVQADSSISREYGGSGLGLSIVHEIVALMGGKIWVKSKEGEGSVFTVVLPLRVAEAPPQPEKIVAEPIQEVDSPLPPLCLLLVDDVDVNRDLIKAFLEDHPVEIVEASHGQEAVERCARRRFDLVLMDVEMPEMNGMEALRQIHEAEKAEGRVPTSIYALTAHALKEQQEGYLKAGAKRVITKPIRKNELIDALREGARSVFTERPQPLPLDLPRLVHEYNGHQVRAVGMVRKFVASLSDQCEAIQAILAASDLEGVRCWAHKTKGAASTLAADPLARTAGILEWTASAQNGKGCQEAMRAVQNDCIQLGEFVRNTLRIEIGEERSENFNRG